MLFTTRKVILLMLMLPMLSAEVSAGTENYSASECVWRSGGAIGVDFNGAIFNTSSTTRSRVVCHVPHTDFGGFFSAGGIEGGFVHVIDLNSSRNIRCRFRSRSINDNGTLTSFNGAMSSTTGFGTERRVLSLRGVSENSISGYVLACVLPPRTSNGDSKIFTYQVRQ